MLDRNNKYLSMKTTIMNLASIILFCISFGSITNGASIRVQTHVDGEQTVSVIEETVVGQDAAELAQLFLDLWSLKPDVLYEEGPLVMCQFVDQCCENEGDRSRAISRLVDQSSGSFTDEDSEMNLFNECVNTTDLKEAIQSCPPIRHILYPVITEKEKSDELKYVIILSRYIDQMDSLIKSESGSCNKEEKFAIWCSKDIKLIESCFNKTLQNMYDENDSQVYQNFVIGAKQNFTTGYQQMLQLDMKRMHKEMKPILRIISKYNSRKT